MRRSTPEPRRLVLALLLAAQLQAQQPVGIRFRCGAPVTSRGNTVQAVERLHRVEHDELRGIGASTAAPNVMRLRGARFVLQDQDGSTPASYDFVVRLEGAVPDEPDTGTPFALLSNLPGSFGGPGPTAVSITLTFATPIDVPFAGDVFVGCALPAAPTWPADGLSLLLGLGGGLPSGDVPGPAPIARGGYALSLVAGPTPSIDYAPPSQLELELLTDAPGGCVTAITNQLSQPLSNTAPGSASAFSALHPDAALPPRSPGRADDIGRVHLDVGLADGSPVLFFASLGAIGPEVPLSGMLPGSVGVWCLPPGAVALGLSTQANGQASWVTMIPAATRPLLRGLLLVQQSLGFDAATTTLRAGPCGRQAF